MVRKRKMRIYDAIVKSAIRMILRHRSEINKKKLNAGEMHALRRSSRTSSTERVRNEIIREQMNNCGRYTAKSERPWCSGHSVGFLCQKRGFDSHRKLSGFQSVAPLTK